jgi:hypothetical protein
MNEGSWDKSGFKLDVDWSTAKRFLSWARTTIITLGLGAGGWHARTVNAKLDECEHRLERIEKTLRAEKILPPGPNPGGTASGPPPVR